MSKHGKAGKQGSGARSGKSVSDARLHQRSGVDNSFGGYAKINEGGGKFRMYRTGR